MKAVWSDENLQSEERAKRWTVHELTSSRDREIVSSSYQGPRRPGAESLHPSPSSPRRAHPKLEEREPGRRLLLQGAPRAHRARPSAVRHRPLLMRPLAGAGAGAADPQGRAQAPRPRRAGSLDA